MSRFCHVGVLVASCLTKSKLSCVQSYHGLSCTSLHEQDFVYTVEFFNDLKFIHRIYSSNQKLAVENARR